MTIITIILSFFIGVLSTAIPHWFFIAIFALIFLTLCLIKNPENLFLILLGFSPLLREYVNYSGNGIPNITFDRVILLALGTWLLFDSIKAHISGKINPGINNSAILYVVIILYLFFELVGYLRGVWPITTAGQYYLDRALLPMVTFILARKFTMTKGKIFVWRVFSIIVWIGIYSLTLEILRRYVGIENLLYPNGRTYLWADVPGTRAVGEFYNPAIFGCMIIMSLAALYYDFFPRQFNKEKWLIIFLFIWMIVLTFTRAVWLSFIIITVMILFFGPMKIKNRFLFLITSLLVFSIVLGFVQIRQTEIGKRLFQPENIQFREDYALKSVEMIYQKPIMGWGAGKFDNKYYTKVFDYYTGSYRTIGNPAHNSFLLMIVDRGLVTFIPYIALIMIIIIKSVPIYKNGDLEIKKAIYFLWTGIINLVIAANFIQLEYFPYIIFMFWLLLGILSGLQTKRV